MELDKIFRSRRLSLNLTITEIAKRVGMKRPNYSKIENGKVKPREITRRKICKALEMDNDYQPIDTDMECKLIFKNKSNGQIETIFEITGKDQDKPVDPSLIKNLMRAMLDLKLSLPH